MVKYLVPYVCVQLEHCTKFKWPGFPTVHVCWMSCGEDSRGRTMGEHQNKGKAVLHGKGEDSEGEKE